MKLARIKSIFPIDSPPRFNFGAWKFNSLETYLLGREVTAPSKSYYQPDISNLLFVKMSGSKVIYTQTIWKAEKDWLLEDPRALVLGKNKVLLGLTAVIKTDSRWVTYPAIATFNNLTLRLSKVSVIQTFGRGKNSTPIKRGFMMFRPSSRDYFHKFLVFKFKNDKAVKYGDLSVPPVSWGSWKIGASAPPIWLTKTRALLFLVGINFINHEYVYSIGKAFLEFKKGEFRISQIDEKPFITRGSFAGFSVRELHPHQREVVYMCGAVVNKNKTIDLYVNVGDRHTLLVTMRLDDLV